MNESNNFNHIKVTPSEEEDVIIHAGASQSTDAKRSDDDAIRAIDGDGALVSDPRPDGGSVSEEHSSDALGEDTAQEPSRSVRGRATNEADDGYKETTLEDIESSKMSTTQRAIIVIAILAVIVFAIYTAINS